MRSYFALDHSEKATLLADAAAEHGRRAEVLEKDVWICWALNVLFDDSDAVNMAFKGGTSLSKVFDLIHRFSEDVDVTLDYRSLAPDAQPLDAGLSGTAKRRLSDELREAVRRHVHEVIKPRFEEKAAALEATVEVDDSGENLKVYYESAAGTDRQYLREHVLLEFGGRNITEPSDRFEVTPDIAATYATVVEFPVAHPVVLSPERTFWEKLTAIHYECNRPAFKSDANRLARHWYDVYQLLDRPAGQNALRNRELLQNVVDHKRVFYNAGYAKYEACLAGEFRLFPADVSPLRIDYEAMIDAGMFFRDPPAFDQIHARLVQLEQELPALLCEP